MKRNYLISVAVAMIVYLIYIPVYAQQELVEWVKAPIGKLPPIGSYSLTYYPKQDVKDQDTSFKLLYHNVLGLIPVINESNKDLAVLGLFSMRDMDTNAVLPKSGVLLPDKLYDLSIGPIYRYKFTNDWVGGASLLLGSASNKLFHSSDEFTIRFDAYIQVPTVEKNSWLFYVDYSNNRSYLNGYPIPGVGYWYKPSDNFEVVIGLPVAYMKYVPFEKLTFDFTYIAITEVDAKLSYDITPSLYVYGEFEWNNELYARADREERKDRLSYYEKLLSAGIHWQVFKYVGIDVSGGYSFDRFLFEGKEFKDRKDNKIDIKNGPFIEIRVGFPF